MPLRSRSRWRDIDVHVVSGDYRNSIRKPEDAFEYRHEPFGWTDYAGEKVVVIPNFDFTTFCIHDLLRNLDGAPEYVNTRGGVHLAEWTSVLIISAKTPEKWYPQIEKPYYDALVRRVPSCNCHTLNSQEDVSKFEAFWAERHFASITTSLEHLSVH